MYIIHQQIKARKDLEEIWLYSFKEHGEQQADKYYDELIAGMETIQENPHIGVACSYIRSGYRQYQINQHIVFYRLSTDIVHIIRVLHESMDVKNYL